jgi:hypothetical protein
MNKLTKLLGALLVFGVASSAHALQLKLSGDLNHRFMVYTDQATLYSASETIASANTNPVPRRVIADGTIQEAFGELKYRLTAEMATDDKKVRGVYGIELGAIRFGSTVASPGANSGGGFSGDGVNVETRFAYVDYELFQNHRVTVGLMPFVVNKYLWSETATGVSLKGAPGAFGYTLAWVRGTEVFNSLPRDQMFKDSDHILLRGDYNPNKTTKIGLFGLYQHMSPEVILGGATPPVVGRSHLLKRFSNVEYDLYNVGLDGGIKAGALFANWDLIYQGGTSQAPGAALTVGGPAEKDHQAFFGHLDLGLDMGAVRVTYTGWYATGDDNATDGDVENFISTDVDVNDSIVLFEGGYTDDVYFTEAPYFLNFGGIFNKLAIDFKATDKLTLNAAVMYIMAAKEIPIGGGVGNTSRDLGLEVDAAIAYKLTPNMSLAMNAGYLIAGDAMDAWEVRQDGEANRNIFRTTANMRYQF